jgi:hypothetical protein
LIQLVCSAVETKRHNIVLRRQVSQFAVKIIEVEIRLQSDNLTAGATRQSRPWFRILAQPGVKEIAVERRPHNVGIGSPAGNQPRTSAAQRHLCDAAGTEQIYARPCPEILMIPILSGQLQHAGNTPAIFCRETAGIGPYIFHGIRIERTEQPEKMIDVVHGHPVEQHQILVRRSAADIKSGTIIRGRNAGKELQGPKHINFAEGREGFYLLRRYGYLADVSHHVNALACRHHDPFQTDGPLPQFNL